MSLPTEPYSRIERYLAKLAGQDVDIPDKPITRIECYLAYLCDNGGGGGGGYTPAPNAGAHNGIFRGQSLGTEFTSDQSAAIVGGTFEDMYIGDYWTINEVVYRIAGFDIFETPTVIPRVHHAVIVPDTALDSGVMNDTDVVTGGYYSSKMKTDGLATSLALVEAAFGADHIVQHKALFCNSVASSGEPNGGVIAQTKIDLMSEGQVYGRGSWGNPSTGYNVGGFYSRFPLFDKAPYFISIGSWYWLLDVSDVTSFAAVHTDGFSNKRRASMSNGIRPYFCIR